MAQLTDDCFAFGGTLMGVDEAAMRRILNDMVATLPSPKRR